MSRVALIAIAAACALGGCKKRSARYTASQALVAINGANFDKLDERLVSAGQLGDLVACRGTESEWMTGAHRRSWYRDLREIVTAEVWRGHASVELVSIEPVDEARWSVYEPGDPVAGGCTAKKTFGAETHRLTIAVTNSLGDRRESSFAVTMWTFDEDWYLWSSPLGRP